VIALSRQPQCPTEVCKSLELYLGLIWKRLVALIKLLRRIHHEAIALRRGDAIRIADVDAASYQSAVAHPDLGHQIDALVDLGLLAEFRSKCHEVADFTDLGWVEVI